MSNLTDNMDGVDSTTPANRSKIPRVNFIAPRVARTLADISLSGSIMSGGSVPRKLVTSPAKSMKGTMQPRSTAAVPSRKRPLNCRQENVREIKKPTLEPATNQKGKLPPWDIKGKLKRSEEMVLELKASLYTLKAENLEVKNAHRAEQQQMNALETELRNKSEQLESEVRQRLETQEMHERLQIEYDEMQGIHRVTKLDLETAQHILGLKEERLGVLSRNVEDLNTRAEQWEAASSVQKKTLVETQASLEDCRALCGQLQEKVKSYELDRKVLHDKVMELKGNIRVFCRVRPFLGAERDKSVSMDHITFTDENSMEVFKGPKKMKHSFSYDRVFPPSAKQADIFEELSELVQSAVDGYNVCVFAYGQTGSGKTYTMEGGSLSEDTGMIPRSVNLIFEKLEDLEKLGWTYQVEASFLEIYNEQVRDLLHSCQSEKSCKIMNPTAVGGDMMVTNLKVEVVQSASHVNDLLNVARTTRAVAATVHNDRSSRSHFVFKLHLHVNRDTGKETDCVLNLVDLAGCERLVEISDYERVTETKNINRSLSNLGNVILALGQKNHHVPYRNSKLTHLLQPSLGGNSKTLMIVNLSPDKECLEETLNSLRFAMRVNECHIGRVRCQVKC